MSSGEVFLWSVFTPVFLLIVRSQQKLPSVPERAKHDEGEQQPKRDHNKRSEDAVAAAKERFLAQKRAKNAYCCIEDSP